MVSVKEMFGAAGVSGMGSSIASLMFVYAIFRQYFPDRLRRNLARYFDPFMCFFSPYIQITIHEYTGERFRRSEGYIAIKTYLAANSSKQAKRLKADFGQTAKSMILSMADHEEITDEYEGIKFWWTSSKAPPTSRPSFSVFPIAADDKHYYKVTFHRKHRGLVTETYLSHVFQEGQAIAVRNRQRKIYTNNPSHESSGYRGSVWSHVVFEHPSTFRTLAMDEEKKKDIIDDLKTFRNAKDYYAKVGKAWKRGYLLYGPPGTGKSTMIAAIANFMQYDIYDLELTAVKDNTEMRKLLIGTSNKSIIVIEDIDCSLDLTGQREEKEVKVADKEGEDPISKKKRELTSNTDSKVTLSGLLNFIDGLWSACGGERIIIFTTNYINKLDPALIRRGRMDKRIEMSYCTFGAFKVLAKNYLDIESHHLFEIVKQLLEENQITPADVAENLMPKSAKGDLAELCLENLIVAIKDIKEEARLKAEEAAKLKADEVKAKLKAAEDTKEPESPLKADEVKAKLKAAEDTKEPESPSQEDSNVDKSLPESGAEENVKGQGK